MKTLVIYDDIGNIFSQVSGDYLIPQGGIQYLEIEVPEGKQVASVDVSVEPHQPILEDIPPSEIEVQKEIIDTLGQELTDIKIRLILGGM